VQSWRTFDDNHWATIADLRTLGGLVVLDREEARNLAERTIEIGGRSWLVRHIENQDALLEMADGRAQFPFGLMLWESGVALATWVADHAGEMPGQTVLELGAGVGLPGIVAASFAATVTQTDHDPQALNLAAHNAALNGVTGINVESGDWFAWTNLARYDLILGADIVYDGADHAAILALFERLLEPGGRIVLADPGRKQQAAFVSAAKQAGWCVTDQALRVEDLRSKQPDAELTITLLELTRFHE
jgi:methyltransferase-like protein 23